MGSSILLVILSFFFLARSITARSITADGNPSDSCPFEYLEQPPAKLSCDPYSRKELLLECTVSLSLHGAYSEPLELTTLQWYHGHNLSVVGETELEKIIRKVDVITLLQDSQKGVSIKEEMYRDASSGRLLIRSHLELRRLNLSNAGEYWCTIHFSNAATKVIPSDSVLLEYTDHSHGQPCDMSTALSKPERKCAVSLTEPAPLKPDLEEFVPTSSSLEHDTTSESMTIGEEVTGKSTFVEFYIALGILVTSGSVIALLVLVVVCTCVKYRKMLKGKQNAEEARKTAILHSLTPSDYLVPLPLANMDLSIQSSNGVDYLVYSSDGTIRSIRVANPLYGPDGTLQSVEVPNPVYTPESTTQSIQLANEGTAHQSIQVANPVYGTNATAQLVRVSSPSSDATASIRVNNPLYAAASDAVTDAGHGLTISWLQNYHQQQGATDKRHKSELFVHSYESVMSNNYEDIADYYNPLHMKRNEAYMIWSGFNATQINQLV